MRRGRLSPATPAPARTAAPLRLPAALRSGAGVRRRDGGEARAPNGRDQDWSESRSIGRGRRTIR